MTRLRRILGRLGFALVCGVLGFAVGGAALFMLAVPGSPPLELWHTEELTAEFTADAAAGIRDFSDYQRLEDRLFAELDEKIYRPTGTGPAYRFVRYSKGSPADPSHRDINWNRSFDLSAEEARGGVLLLHGMSDSPYSLRALGQALNASGYRVLGLRLPGHGTAPSGLRHVTTDDMTAAVHLAMAHLAAELKNKPLHIVGYSTGASLALDFALNALDDETEPMPASLVLISPAIAISPAAAFASWKDRLSVLPGLEDFAWTQILPELDPFRYNSFASNAGDVVHRLTRSVRGRIQERAGSGALEAFPATLVFLSAVDATVSTNAVVDDLLARLAGDRHELVLFDINRMDVASTLLVADPAPLTDRMLNGGPMPFALTLVTNADPDSAAVVSSRKAASSNAMTTTALGLSWPPGTVSLSHVALPFSPDDPLYGRRPPSNDDVLFLGEMAIRGERGIHRLPADWLLRLRHNPFYDVVEARTLAWIDGNHGSARP